MFPGDLAGKEFKTSGHRLDRRPRCLLRPLFSLSVRLQFQEKRFELTVGQPGNKYRKTRGKQTIHRILKPWRPDKGAGDDKADPQTEHMIHVDPIGDLSQEIKHRIFQTEYSPRVLSRI